MIKALTTELGYYKAYFPKLTLNTLFIGGGTPSALRAESLETLLEAVKDTFDMPQSSEKTCEMNPESVSLSQLKVLKKFNFNRISLGVQSFDLEELQFLGRNHSPEKVEWAVSMLKEAQFDNFNLDFIFGLPNSKLSVLEKTLNRAIALNPTHLSTYSLSIERGTVFSKKKQEKATQELELKQYQFIRKYLGQYGYEHYEVSAFSKPGYRCAHNLAYWQLTPFIGIGPSGASFFQERHYTQTKHLELYLKKPIPLLLQKELSPLPKAALVKDYIIANLRRLEGITLADINARFNINFLEKYAPQLKKLQRLKWISLSSKKVKVTLQGLYLLDHVLEEFI